MPMLQANMNIPSLQYTYKYYLEEFILVSKHATKMVGDRSAQIASTNRV